MHRLGGGCRLRAAHVGVAVDDLALEVGPVHHIVVNHAEGPDPGRGEVEQGGRAEPPRADDEHSGGPDPPLADGPDLGEQDVAGVAAALGGGQLRPGRDERRQTHAGTIQAPAGRPPRGPSRCRDRPGLR